eukprot:TRINITY_DN9350_c0_g2_i1.p1 TRINITY_DN9350_c0_g2~~TRINITY_DN9350_c0_g2_i1.p1  ORF type:complete len:241 (+),score=35.48 TRINITY_DN9350_c0_g2_i1:137-859(+)
MAGLRRTLLVVLGINSVGAVRLQNSDTSERKRSAQPGVIVRRPGDVVPNDLWGIGDLVMAGHAAIFMRRESEGARNVRTSMQKLVELLPKLHPVPLCREKIGEAIAKTSVGAVRNSLVAKAAWSCLPGNFTMEHFDNPFLEEYLDDYERAKASMNVQLKDPNVLGACKETGWPRTCSYWSSAHAMAYRADALGLAKPFLRSLFPVFASGVLQCVGCTFHFRSVHEPVLSHAVLFDNGTSW